MIPLALSITLAHAAPPADFTEQVEAAWNETTGYCASFVFAVHGTKNMAVNTGKSCVDRTQKRLLTETDSPLGPIVDIRKLGEAWYYDPAKPVVLHLVAEEGTVDETKGPGQGLGGWVELLSNAESMTVLEDVQIDERPHWRVVLPNRDNDGTTVLFVDQEYLLPTAVELRKNNVALLSSGYTELSLNPELPDTYFEIRPLFNVPTVEVAWDLSQSPSEVEVPAGEFSSQP